MRRVIFLSILIAVLAAFFASANPDGLEWVAEKLGFLEQGVEQSSLMTDYAVPVISQAGISTAIAGILGVFIVFGLFWTAAKFLHHFFFA